MTRDETRRWSTQPGDYVLWLNWPFLHDEPTLVDFFYFRDSEYFLATARETDLPAGFELHPTEVSGRYTTSMMMKLEAGWEPKEVVKSDFIWRACAGDRLVWIRPNSTEEPILEVLELDVCVVACATLSGTVSLEQIMNLGGAPDEFDKIKVGAAFQAAKTRVIQMGPARVAVDEWRFGS